jgi:hypothetical protein
VQLQWWQWIAGGATLLGMSPAPWITALLTRRLMPLSAHLERVADLKEQHSLAMQALKEQHARELQNDADDLTRMLADRDHERAATRLERERADNAAAKLAALTEGFGKVTVGLLSAGEKRYTEQRELQADATQQ